MTELQHIIANPTAYNDGTTAYNNKPTAYNDRTIAYNDKPTSYNKYYHIRQLWRSIETRGFRGFPLPTDMFIYERLTRQ